jgi:hypothetical protein
MADPHTYQRIALKFQSPWNIASETTHDWSLKFNLTGSVLMGDADAEATALALAQGPLALASPRTALIEYSYYPAGATVASSYKTYALGTHMGTQAGYVSTAGVQQQLEVCILFRAPVGKNIHGKQVYLRKWVHDVLADGGDPNACWNLNPLNTIIGAWMTGAGPHQVVPVSPSTGTPGSPWSAEVHLFTHQLRRGAKRKKLAPGASVSSILQAIGTGVAAKAILEEALAALA